MDAFVRSALWMARLATVPVLMAGCGTSIGESGAADGGSGLREGGTSSGSMCGSSPTRLVDWVHDVPDAGKGSVTIPVIAVNATDVYFLLWWAGALGSGTSDLSDGYLMRVPIHGGDAVRVAFIPGGASQGPQALAVTPTGAIFSEVEQDAGSAGGIVHVSADGADATVLAATKGLANAILVVGDTVYFVDTEATKAVPLTGGPVRVVAAAVPYSLGVIGQTLYLADLSGGTISSVPIDGGPITLLAKNQEEPSLPIACGPSLCWVNASSAGTGTLMQLAPGGTPSVLASGFVPRDLDFDGRNFFITSGGFGGALWRIPPTGGNPVVVEADLALMYMALDETCLYWSSLHGIFNVARSVADMAGGTRQ